MGFLGYVTFWGLPVILIILLFVIVATKKYKKLYFALLFICTWLVLNYFKLGCYICPHGSCGCDSINFLILDLINMCILILYSYIIFRLIGDNKIKRLSEYRKWLSDVNNS